MKDKLRTAKSRAMILMILFALIMTILVFALSSKVIYDFQRRVTAQSVEFNLQLVAGIIAQDMRDLENFGRWCGVNETIGAWFVSSRGEGALEAWRRLSEEFHNNRASPFVNRLLIFDNTYKRVLQVGNLINAAAPVTNWNVDAVFTGGISGRPGWQGLVGDPFHFTRKVPVIPLVNHLYHPGRGTVIGTVVLMAPVSLVTGKLAAYKVPPDTELYLSIQDRYYRLEDGDFIPQETSWTELSRGEEYTMSPQTVVINIRDRDGRRRTLVSLPIRKGINLIQTLHRLRFFPAEGAWPALAAGMAVLLLLLALLWSGINRQTGEIAALMEKRLADEKKARDLEYRMLQNQINPHFLYNTLNSIKWMASIQNASGIAEMATVLSRLLRTVTKDTRKTASLREELALLDDYLVIQKYRYGDSVTVKKEIAEDSLLDTPIPRFTLQPLAENAIFHGLEPKGGGTITVRVRPAPDDALTLVSIEDDGVGMSDETIAKIRAGLGAGPGSPEREPDGGVFRELGLRNVEERLRHAFGKDGKAGGLSIASREGKYTVITITLKREADPETPDRRETW
ncbi:MAG: sensor histidine kinase [Treponema sp.]|nr:sensor histidine kinase [Treponema sp.]